MFEPWIGPLYGMGQRIMVLGESHHSAAIEMERAPTGDETRMTCRLTSDFVEGRWRHAFWSKTGGLVSRYLAGSSKDGALNPREAFKRIVFYNFADSFVVHHRDNPSDECVKRSRNELIQVLDGITAKPELIIALGAQRQPWFLSNIPGFKYADRTPGPFVARYKETKLVVCNHPQGRFSYKTALKQLHDGIAIAENM